MRRWALVVGVVVLGWAKSASASSALDLVESAHRHEKANEDDIALRRYTDALSIDPSCEEAYLGLGALRARRGDLREAERVYSVALEHRPDSKASRVARANVRRGLGAMNDAIADLFANGETVEAMRTLAKWRGEDGQVPAQLAVWRRIAQLAETTNDAGLGREAHTMVKALVLLVGPADPAAAPSDERNQRKLIAKLAKR